MADDYALWRPEAEQDLDSDNIDQQIAVLRGALVVARGALTLTVAHCGTNYDWNADPLSLTLVQGEAFKTIQTALALTAVE